MRRRAIEHARWEAHRKAHPMEPRGSIADPNNQPWNGNPDQPKGWWSGGNVYCLLHQPARWEARVRYGTLEVFVMQGRCWTCGALVFGQRVEGTQ